MNDVERCCERSGAHDARQRKISGMLLPRADDAEIDPRKLHEYLLSTTHPVGRFKARFFKALGYSAGRWHELEADIRAQHLTQDAEPSELVANGQFFTIRAS